MNISEEVHFSKDGQIVRFPVLRKLFIALIILLVASLSFAIGRLTSTGEKQGIKIEYDPSLTAAAISSVPQTSKLTNLQTSIVASKNGSKYHFLHCPGAKQIKEANKITFDSPMAAEASGYTLASNCAAP